MSKETREMLKTILSKQDLILKHLELTGKTNEKLKKDTKTPAKKVVAKEVPAKKSKAAKTE